MDEAAGRVGAPVGAPDRLMGSVCVCGWAQVTKISHTKKTTSAAATATGHIHRHPDQEVLVLVRTSAERNNDLVVGYAIRVG